MHRRVAAAVLVVAACCAGTASTQTCIDYALLPGDPVALDPGGTLGALDRDGDILCAGVRTRLVVCNVTGRAPVVAGSLDLIDGSITDVAVSGTRRGGHGLLRIAGDRPHRSRLAPAAGSLNGYAVSAVTLNGTIACGPAGSADNIVVDLADPTAPAVVAAFGPSAPGLHSVFRLAVDGDVAWITNYGGNFGATRSILPIRPRPRRWDRSPFPPTGIRSGPPPSPRSRDASTWPGRSSTTQAPCTHRSCGSPTAPTRPPPRRWAIWTWTPRRTGWPWTGPSWLSPNSRAAGSWMPRTRRRLRTA